MAKKAGKTMQDNLAVIDEERRRGRRRLVGAIALALFAVLVVPILLYRAPDPASAPTQLEVIQKPTLEVPDPKIEEPPPPESTAATELPQPPAEIPVVTEPAPLPPSVATAPPEKVVEVAPEKPLPLKVEEALSAPKLAPKPAPKKDDNAGVKKPETVKPETPKAEIVKPETTKPETTKPEIAKPEAPKPEPVKTVAVRKGTYSVQVNAYSDDKGANALVARLKDAGYNAYVEPSLGNKMVWRVRVGGYATRQDADKIQKQLVKAGHKKSFVTETP